MTTAEPTARVTEDHLWFHLRSILDALPPGCEARRIIGALAGTDAAERTAADWSALADALTDAGIRSGSDWVRTLLLDEERWWLVYRNHNAPIRTHRAFWHKENAREYARDLRELDVYSTLGRARLSELMPQTIDEVKAVGIDCFND